LVHIALGRPYPSLRDFPWGEHMPSPGTFLGLQPLEITWRKWKFILNKSFIYIRNVVVFFSLFLSYSLWSFSLVLVSLLIFLSTFLFLVFFMNVLVEVFFISSFSIWCVFISSSSLVNLFVFYVSSIFFFCVFDLASSLFIFTFFYIPISSSHYLFIS
jgi:hypothetical protein